MPSTPCGACRGAASPVCESWRKGQASAVAQQREAGGAVEKKKNRSRFELLDVADHTFYHFNVNAAYFEQLLNSWSAFMVEQGIWEYNEGMDTGLLG